MTSKFMRLYRELGRSEPDKKIHDTSYVKDRTEVLELIVQRGGRDASVPRPLKHHGKLARQRRLPTQRPDSASHNNREDRGSLAAVLASGEDNPGNEILATLRARRVRLQEQVERDLQETGGLSSAKSSKSSLSVPASSSSAKLQQQKQLNHIAYKHEQTKALIRSELQPLVEAQQKVPKRVIQSLLYLENRLSSTDEKLQNASETLTSLGFRSKIPDANEQTNAHSSSSSHTTSEKNGSIQRKKSVPSMVSTASEKTTQSRYVPTEQHITRLHNDSYTVNRHSKWSDEERERMRRLLLELPLPSSKFSKLDQTVNPVNHKIVLSANQVELWKLYFDHFSDRFRVFHPHRSRAEIEAKLRSVIAKKQFKLHGEESYWRFIQHGGLQGQEVLAAPREMDGSGNRDEKLRLLEMEML